MLFKKAKRKESLRGNVLLEHWQKSGTNKTQTWSNSDAWRPGSGSEPTPFHKALFTFPVITIWSWLQWNSTWASGLRTFEEDRWVFFAAESCWIYIRYSEYSSTELCHQAKIRILKSCCHEKSSTFCTNHLRHHCRTERFCTEVNRTELCLEIWICWRRSS